MLGLLLKTVAIWFVILVAAIANAAIREKLLVPAFGSGIALPVSGLLLTVFIFLIAYAFVPLFGGRKNKTYLAIGAVWFFLTLAFEFVFGHFVAGKPWHEILRVFDVSKGDLFVVALCATLVAPWVTAKLRRLGDLSHQPP